MADLIAKDFDCANRIGDWSGPAAEGRQLICYDCGPMTRTTDRQIIRANVAPCKHVVAELVAGRDRVPLDAAADFAFAVPIARQTRLAPTLAVRPLGEYRDDSEYVGNVLVTYRLPGWQSDSNRVIELDVLPYKMLTRMEVRSVLIRYLRDKWDRVLRSGVPCEAQHPASRRAEWQRLAIQMEKLGNHPNSDLAYKYLASLWLWDQGRSCWDCHGYSPDDDVPRV